MVELEQTAEGIVLPVQAQPRAKRNAVVGIHAGRLKVAVTQAPEKGKANDAIVKVLTKHLGLKRSQIRLRSGSTSPQKTFLVTDVALEDLQTRVVACLAGDFQ